MFSKFNQSIQKCETQLLQMKAIIDSKLDQSELEQVVQGNTRTHLHAERLDMLNPTASTWLTEGSNRNLSINLFTFYLQSF